MLIFQITVGMEAAQDSSKQDSAKTSLPKIEFTAKDIEETLGRIGQNASSATKRDVDVLSFGLRNEKFAERCAASLNLIVQDRADLVEEGHMDAIAQGLTRKESARACSLCLYWLAEKRPELFKEGHVDALARGLENKQSQYACSYALALLAEKRPELFKEGHVDALARGAWDNEIGNYCIDALTLLKEKRPEFSEKCANALPKKPKEENPSESVPEYTKKMLSRKKIREAVDRIIGRAGGKDAKEALLAFDSFLQMKGFKEGWIKKYWDPIVAELLSSCSPATKGWQALGFVFKNIDPEYIPEILATLKSEMKYETKNKIMPYALISLYYFSLNSGFEHGVFKDNWKKTWEKLIGNEKVGRYAKVPGPLESFLVENGCLDVATTPLWSLLSSRALNVNTMPLFIEALHAPGNSLDVLEWFLKKYGTSEDKIKLATEMFSKFANTYYNENDGSIHCVGRLALQVLDKIYGSQEYLSGRIRCDEYLSGLAKSKNLTLSGINQLGALLAMLESPGPHGREWNSWMEFYLGKISHLNERNILVGSEVFLGLGGYLANENVSGEEGLALLKQLMSIPTVDSNGNKLNALPVITLEMMHDEIANVLGSRNLDLDIMRTFVYSIDENDGRFCIKAKFDCLMGLLENPRFQMPEDEGSNAESKGFEPEKTGRQGSFAPSRSEEIGSLYLLSAAKAGSVEERPFGAMTIYGEQDWTDDLSLFFKENMRALLSNPSMSAEWFDPKSDRYILDMVSTEIPSSLLLNSSLKKEWLDPKSTEYVAGLVNDAKQLAVREMPESSRWQEYEIGERWRSIIDPVLGNKNLKKEWLDPQSDKYVIGSLFKIFNAVGGNRTDLFDSPSPAALKLFGEICRHERFDADIFPAILSVLNEESKYSKEAGLIAIKKLLDNPDFTGAARESFSDDFKRFEELVPKGKNYSSAFAALYRSPEILAEPNKYLRVELIIDRAEVFEKLGIECFERYTPKTLENTYWTAINSQFSDGKKIAFVMLGKEDKSGAFAQQADTYETYANGVYLFSDKSVSGDTQVQDYDYQKWFDGLSAADAKKVSSLKYGESAEVRIAGKAYNVMRQEDGRTSVYEAYCILICEAESDLEAKDRYFNYGTLREGGRSPLAGKSYDLFVFGGHGAQDRFSLGPASQYDDADNVDVKDLTSGKFGSRGSWSQMLADGADVVLVACGTSAEVQAGTSAFDSIADKMSELFYRENSGIRLFAPSVSVGFYGLSHEGVTGRLEKALWRESNGNDVGVGVIYYTDTGYKETY